MLYALNYYTFGSWFNKESIPKNQRDKKPTTTAATTTTVTDDTYEDTIMEEAEQEVLQDDDMEENDAPPPSLAQLGYASKKLLNRYMMRTFLAAGGCDSTNIRFHPSHPQYATHRLTLANRIQMLILNGPRMKSKAMLEAAMTEDVDEEGDNTVNGGNGQDEEDDFLRWLAIWTPWHAANSVIGGIVWASS